jgi:integrase
LTALAEAWRETLIADVRTKTKILRGLLKYFDPAGTRPARDVRPDEILSWRAGRLKKVSGRTVNYELQVLKAVFEFGVSVKKILLANPASGIKPAKHEPIKKNVPTISQFRSLVEALRLEPKAAVVGGAADMVELLAYTGLRRQAIQHLTWEDFNFEESQVRLRNTKLSRWYFVPLYPALRNFVIELRERSLTAKPQDRLIKINDCKKSLDGACKRAGLPSFSHHSLRHFFASNAVALGVDFLTVASWLDHADGGVLVAKVYSHVRQEHSEEMARRMNVQA